MKNVIAALIAGLFAIAAFAQDAVPAAPSTDAVKLKPAKPTTPAKIKTKKAASTAPK